MSDVDPFRPTAFDASHVGPEKAAVEPTVEVVAHAAQHVECGYLLANVTLPDDPNAMIHCAHCFQHRPRSEFEQVAVTAQ